MSRLYVLGAAGSSPTQQRLTSCYLIETRRVPVMLDAGSGIVRLHDPSFQELFGAGKRMTVVLCGYTAGRLGGVAWLPRFCGEIDLIVAGPVAFGGPEAVLARHLEAPFYPGGIERWKAGFRSVSFVSLTEGKNEVGGEALEACVLVDEPEPVLGVRIRDVAYVTGCPPRPETLELARDGSVLVHDASGEERGATATDAARIASQAGVQDLLLAHLGPEQDASGSERLLFEATAHFPRSFVAADMMCFKMSDATEDAEELKPGTRDAPGREPRSPGEGAQPESEDET